MSYDTAEQPKAHVSIIYLFYIFICCLLPWDYFRCLTIKRKKMKGVEKEVKQYNHEINNEKGTQREYCTSKRLPRRWIDGEQRARGGVESAINATVGFQAKCQSQIFRLMWKDSI